MSFIYIYDKAVRFLIIEYVSFENEKPWTSSEANESQKHSLIGNKAQKWRYILIKSRQITNAPNLSRSSPNECASQGFYTTHPFTNIAKPPSKLSYLLPTIKVWHEAIFPSLYVAGNLAAFPTRLRSRRTGAERENSPSKEEENCGGRLRESEREVTGGMRDSRSSQIQIFAPRSRRGSARRIVLCSWLFASGEQTPENALFLARNTCRRKKWVYRGVVL